MPSKILSRLVLAASLLTAAFLPGAARADQVELDNGSILHGKILTGQTSDEGLAVELYETGGVLLVRWDHIEAGRRKQLQVDTGILSAEGEDIYVAGHDVLLANGTHEFGLVVNEDQKGEPVKVKTATSQKEYPRDQVARITAVQLPGLLLYTPNDLYQRIRDENPPDSARAHRDLAITAMDIGALGHAREHLNQAKSDAAFSASPEGRALDGLFRQLDLLEKSAGARELKTQIQLAMNGKRWNEAKTKLDKLAKDYTDENVRRTINFSGLESKVIRGRNDYFFKELPRRVHTSMVKMIGEQAKVKKPLREDPDAPRGPGQGTLAAARTWLSREFPKAMWEKVTAELGLTGDEMEEFWKKRKTTANYTANYGTGSFIVIKKAAAAGTSGAPGGRNDQDRARRPKGSERKDSAGGPPKAAKDDKPKTEEEWYEGLAERPGDRAKFLVAYFAENGGLWEVLRADENEICDGCGGKGVLTEQSTAGGASNSVCPKCNGATKFRKVSYR